MQQVQVAEPPQSVSEWVMAKSQLNPPLSNPNDSMSEQSDDFGVDAPDFHDVVLLEEGLPLPSLFLGICIYTFLYVHIHPYPTMNPNERQQENTIHNKA